MINKHCISIGIAVSIIFFIIAAAYYPGGSQNDLQWEGYNLRHNYLCHLFNEKALNGALNMPTRLWAILGMFVLCSTIAVFFHRFSTKISVPTAAKTIKYCGISSMIFAFLVSTPYHDLMTTISSVLALIAIFYMTVFIFKSKLTFFKLLSIGCIAILYLNNYIYYSQQFLAYLPVLQKISFVLVFILILSLDYFTEKEDFQEKT